MAAPITHIVLTEKIFPKYFKNKNEREFYVGTSFPDIRYMGVIERNKTHFKDLKLQSIIEEDSFNAGMQFHSLLDKVREDFVVSRDVYSLVPESQFITQAIKFLEDEILHDKIEDWSKYINYFDEIVDAEKYFGITDEALMQWHTTLQRTFLKKPTAIDLEAFVANIGRPKKMADEINALLLQLRKNTKVLDIIRDLCESFPDLVERF